MGRFRRFFQRIAQTDEERLSGEVLQWAEAVPLTVRISECQARTSVRVAGVVRRMTLRPKEESETLEVVVSDGTGELLGVWTGRDRIPGLQLGTRLVLEGLCSPDQERPELLRIVNPRFEFA